MKKVSLTLVFFLTVVLSAYAGCYEFWIEDFDDAEAEYYANLEYCRSLMQGDRVYRMCMEEANKRFDHQIHEAGIDYYRCTFS